MGVVGVVVVVVVVVVGVVVVVVAVVAAAVVVASVVVSVVALVVVRVGAAGGVHDTKKKRCKVVQYSKLVNAIESIIISNSNMDTAPK